MLDLCMYLKLFVVLCLRCNVYHVCSIVMHQEYVYPCMCVHVLILKTENCGKFQVLKGQDCNKWDLLLFIRIILKLLDSI